MALLVLGYPTLEAADYRRIQAFRADHDPLFRIVAPHFTLVFPLDDALEETVIPQVRRMAKQQPKVNFVLRRAQPVAPLPGEADALVFLVPAEGYDALVHLHDQLYAGPLAPHLRQDTSFMPHITVGRKQEQTAAEQAAAEFGAQTFAMPGSLGVLTVVRYVNGLVTNVVAAPLLG
jgi:2'-5' RNA ligase